MRVVVETVIDSLHAASGGAGCFVTTREESRFGSITFYLEGGNDLHLNQSLTITLEVDE